MGIISDAVVSKDNLYAGSSAALNLAHGGQNGVHNKIGTIIDGKNYDEWMSNQAYVSRNIIPIVLRYPKFFDLLPDSKKWIEAYKALIELHPLTIEGLTSGLTVETDEHAVGGSGEMQEEITDVKRARSTVSFTYKEKAGKTIQKLLDYIIRYGYMDPDVKRPLVVNLLSDDDFKTKVGDMYTADFYTGTVLFIEPDITHKYVVDAWLTTNMFFKSNGDRTGKRDINSAGAGIDLSIESSGITLNNKAVTVLAETILGKITTLGEIPDESMVVPQVDVDATLKGIDNGFTGVMQ